MVDMPGVDPEDVTVQLYAGPINSRGEIEQPQALSMNHAKALAPERHLFIGRIGLPQQRTAGLRDPDPAGNGGSRDALRTGVDYLELRVVEIGSARAIPSNASDSGAD